MGTGTMTMGNFYECCRCLRQNDHQIHHPWRSCPVDFGLHLAQAGDQEGRPRGSRLGRNPRISAGVPVISICRSTWPVGSIRMVALGWEPNLVYWNADSSRGESAPEGTVDSIVTG